MNTILLITLYLLANPWADVAHTAVLTLASHNLATPLQLRGDQLGGLTLADVNVVDLANSAGLPKP